MLVTLVFCYETKRTPVVGDDLNQNHTKASAVPMSPLCQFLRVSKIHSKYDESIQPSGTVLAYKPSVPLWPNHMPYRNNNYTPIESHRLHVFYAVAEAGSVAEAARQLCLTRSALSHALKSLEDDLGCELFHRSARNLVISDAGRRLLPQARQILEAMELARSSLGDL